MSSEYIGFPSGYRSRIVFRRFVMDSACPNASSAPLPSAPLAAPPKMFCSTFWLSSTSLSDLTPNFSETAVEILGWIKFLPLRRDAHSGPNIHGTSSLTRSSARRRRPCWSGIYTTWFLDALLSAASKVISAIASSSLVSESGITSCLSAPPLAFATIFAFSRCSSVIVRSTCR